MKDNLELKNLGDYLISLRKNKGLTQKELGQLLGTTMQVIQKYESTKYQSVSLKRLIKIESILKD